MLTDSRCKLFGQGDESIGIMNPKGIELAIEKSEKITYDLDITQSAVDRSANDSAHVPRPCVPHCLP